MKFTSLEMLLYKNMIVHSYTCTCMYVYSYMYFRLNNHGIMVSDLTDKNRPPPNPVTTFAQAFGSYRKSGDIVFAVRVPTVE